MHNHWLVLAKRKKMFQEIDQIGMEIATEGGNLGDLLDVLSDEALVLLRSLKIQEFLGNPDEKSFEFYLEEDDD